MFCSNCGLEIGVVNFCSSCGAKGIAGDPEAATPAVETLYIKPSAKFLNKSSYELKVVGGDFKAGNWSFLGGQLTPSWGFRGPHVSSKTVERIEVLKDGLSISGQDNAGAGVVAGFMAGGLLGAMVGETLGGAIKKGGSLIRIFFTDGKTMTAIADGDTMASLYGASL